MPEYSISYYGPNESPRIAAWTAHYERKGCHPVKARSVALAKVRRSRTWPHGLQKTVGDA